MEMEANTMTSEDSGAPMAGITTGWRHGHLGWPDLAVHGANRVATRGKASRGIFMAGIAIGCRHACPGRPHLMVLGADHVVTWVGLTPWREGMHVSLQGQLRVTARSLAHSVTLPGLNDGLRRAGPMMEVWLWPDGGLNPRHRSTRMWWRTCVSPRGPGLASPSNGACAQQKHHEWLKGVAPIEEKLVQHRLRWFGHVQRRPSKAQVHCGVLSRDINVRRGRGRPKLTWGRQ